MAKINFTKEHFEKLSSYVNAMVFSNETITTRMGQVFNVIDLLHTTTIGTLNDIRISLGKAIEKLESTDEWVADDSTQEKLENLKAKKEMINLTIGYKRWLLEKAAIEREKKTLNEKLEALVEAKKTPDEKINELKEQLKNLEDNLDGNS